MEVSLLRKRYPTTTAKELATILNRTKSAIQTKALELKLKTIRRPLKRKIWPSYDENLLRDMYATVPVKIIAAQINRTVNEVKQRARTLGIKSLPRDQKKTTLYYYNGEQKYTVTASGCWEWIGGINAKGYGICSGKDSILAHRQVYIDFKGKIPKGKEVDHRCRTRHCVNPDHLEAVTHAVNVSRGWAARKQEAK